MVLRALECTSHGVLHRICCRSSPLTRHSNIRRKTESQTLSSHVTEWHWHSGRRGCNNVSPWSRLDFLEAKIQDWKQPFQELQANGDGKITIWNHQFCSVWSLWFVGTSFPWLLDCFHHYHRYYGLFYFNPLSLCYRSSHSDRNQIFSTREWSFVCEHIRKLSWALFGYFQVLVVWLHSK